MPMTKLSKGYSQYGADMGRITHKAENPSLSFKFYLRQERLDSGAYDSQGAYWGFPDNLYRYESDDSNPEEFAVGGFFRGNSRDEVKRQILALYPNATFYR